MLPNSSQYSLIINTELDDFGEHNTPPKVMCFNQHIFAFKYYDTKTVLSMIVKMFTSVKSLIRKKPLNY